MAKKELTINDLFTKIQKVFPKDLYIVHNRYCVAGKLSDEETIYAGLCILDKEIMDILNGIFKPTDVIYIEDYKVAKETPNTGIQVVTDEEVIKEVCERSETIMNKFTNAQSWDTLPFKEGDVSTLFDKASTIELFGGDTKIPSIITGKDMFPLLTAKTIDTAMYSFLKYDEKMKLASIMFSYNFPVFFDVCLIFNYIDLDNI